MALGGFLGSAINRTLEAVLPKGSRGAIIGEALGIGSEVGANISRAVSGLEEPVIQQLQQMDTGYRTPGTIPQYPTGPVTQQDYLNMQRGRQLVTQGETSLPGAGTTGVDQTLVPDITVRVPDPVNQGVTIGGMCSSAPAMKKIVTVRKTCNGVCVDVSRKQQSMMKKILQDNCMDPQYAASLIAQMIVQQTGIRLSIAEIMCLVNRKFKARPVSISNAQIRSARRMLNDVERINKIAADVKKMAPAPRRSPPRRKTNASCK